MKKEMLEKRYSIHLDFAPSNMILDVEMDDTIKELTEGCASQMLSDGSCQYKFENGNSLCVFPANVNPRYIFVDSNGEREIAFYTVMGHYRYGAKRSVEVEVDGYIPVEKVLAKLKEGTGKKHSRLEICIAIVKEGKSEVFKNWHEHSGCTEEDFIEGLKYLYEEPTRNMYQKTLKSIGCTEKGEIVRLKKVYYEDGSFAGFYRVDNKMNWGYNSILTTFEKV